MPDENKIMSHNWHSESWWMRVFENALSSEEALSWEEHRRSCENCRSEWDALTRFDTLMAHPPVVPDLSPDFASSTIQLVNQKLKWRRLLMILAGNLIVTAISIAIMTMFGNVYQTLEQSLRVIFSARYTLLSSLVQVVMGLIEEWRMVLPLCVGIILILFMVLMPNSALITVAVVWYSRRQRRQFDTV
ncbi:MAG: hypothetical protein P1S60_04015 [Anaerolineae bacterium]|nr:hypothetical protein [Anaerolineae bacterium]